MADVTSGNWLCAKCGSTTFPWHYVFPGQPPCEWAVPPASDEARERVARELAEAVEAERESRPEGLSLQPIIQARSRTDAAIAAAQRLLRGEAP